MKRISLRIPDDLGTKIQQEAKKTGLSMNGFIIVALREYFNRHDSVKSALTGLIEQIEGKR